jgi:hypothetical protein
MHGYTPSPDACLGEWWPKLSNATPKQSRKAMKGQSCGDELWLKRNVRVFDKIVVMPAELV